MTRAVTSAVSSPRPTTCCSWPRRRAGSDAAVVSRLRVPRQAERLPEGGVRGHAVRRQRRPLARRWRRRWPRSTTSRARHGERGADQPAGRGGSCDVLAAGRISAIGTATSSVTSDRPLRESRMRRPDCGDASPPLRPSASASGRPPSRADRTNSDAGSGTSTQPSSRTSMASSAVPVARPSPAISS